MDPIGDFNDMLRHNMQDIGESSLLILYEHLAASLGVEIPTLWRACGCYAILY